jgi:hypothetical protein
VILTGDSFSFDSFNSFLWVSSNILLAVIFISSITFSIAYPLLFKIETTGGWRVWRAIMSVSGFAVISVIGIFVNPQTTPWYAIPPNTLWWRPIVRVLIFGLIAHSFASLVSYLIKRRFFPITLTVRPETVELLESDLRLLYGSGTGLPDPSLAAQRLSDYGWTKPGLAVPLVSTFGVSPRKLGYGRRQRRKQ